MQNTRGDVKNLLDMIDLGRTEDEHIFKKDYMDSESRQSAKLENIIEQFDYIYEQTVKKNDKFEFESKSYIKGINNVIEKHREEAVRLYEISEVIDGIISDVESGKYTMGIRPINIPRDHRVHLLAKDVIPL